ncbi:MAG TPA: phosphoesterase [Candidatus Dormibacteraeota bacterium]|jgi:predicted NUDIX family phosphoesterase|nr:phosphoesterase [Candidatus Dormibacteraeota bacterium]
MPSWRTEEVLVVPREEIFPDGAWHGFIDSHPERYLSIIAERRQFRPRGEVEDDPGFQQIIPYVVFRHDDRYFLTRRLKQSSEKRLRHLYSLGIGGHINREDVSDEADDVVLEGLRREFAEEVTYAGDWTHRLVGLLNDDSNDVSRVHLGLVFEVTGDSPVISIRETEKLEGELLRLEEMKIYYLDMESWSQLIYDHLLAREKAGVR